MSPSDPHGRPDRPEDARPEDSRPGDARPTAPPDDVPAVSAEELVNGEHLVDDDHAEAEAERRYPSTIGGAFYLLVLAVVAVAMVVVVTGSWRPGIRIMAGALFFAAAVRLVLRSRDAGMLAVRHKVLDAIVLVALGGALVFLAGSIPDQPGF